MRSVNLTGLFFCLVLTVTGQDAGDIIRQAIEKTGGVDRWQALQGFKITATFDQGGVEFPLEIVQLKDGRQYTRLDFQGTEIMQGVFDGKVLWSTDFQSQQPRKADPETTANVALDSNDFPDELIDYRKKNYAVELLETVPMNGSQAYKIRITKEPIKVNDQTTPDQVYYYIDTKTLLPLAKEFEMKHGPIQGSIMVIQLGDYREVGGYWFPFAMSQGVKDAPPQPLTVEKVELNPRVSATEFSFGDK